MTFVYSVLFILYSFLLFAAMVFAIALIPILIYIFWKKLIKKGKVNRKIILTIYGIIFVTIVILFLFAASQTYNRKNIQERIKAAEKESRQKPRDIFHLE